MQTILVTGATGTVGSSVVRQLGHADVNVRMAVRSTTKRADSKAEAVAFDFEKPDLMAVALRGVDKVFLLAPSMRDQVGASIRFIELANAAGVKHVVKLSALGCNEEPAIAFGRAHRDVERALEGSGMQWTALRPNNFMDNFLGLRHGAFAPDAQGNIELPWGDSICSFIAADDIAAVAVAVLMTEGHNEKRYDLTGPEALSLTRAAEIMSRFSPRPIRYVDVSQDVTRQKMLRAGMPPPMVEGVLELHALGKAGRASQVTTTVEDLTHRPACTFAKFMQEHASAVQS